MKREDLPKHFCPVPFLKLILSQEGRVRSCRDRWSNVVDKIAPGGDVLASWNSPQLREWRREFLEGKPKICKDIIRHRNCHLWHDSLLEDVELAEVQTKPPIILSPLLNGQCNLRCVMCGIWKKGNGFYDDTNFWEKGPTEIFPFLKVIEMYSGEPFMQKDTFRLIDLVSSVNPRCLWKFNTNGHWRFNETVARALDKVEIKDFRFSIDSLDPKTFAEIRLDGDLSRVLRTVEDLKAYAKRRAEQGRPFQLGVQFVVQRRNWREVPSFVEFCRNQGLMMTLLYAYEPESESIDFLPADERGRIVEFLLEAVETTNDKQVLRTMRTVLDSLQRA